jgi:hypothetical protein
LNSKGVSSLGAEGDAELEIQLIEPTAEYYAPDEREEDVEPASEE